MNFREHVTGGAEGLAGFTSTTDTPEFLRLKTHSDMDLTVVNDIFRTIEVASPHPQLYITNYGA